MPKSESTPNPNEPRPHPDPRPNPDPNPDAPQGEEMNDAARQVLKDREQA